VTYFVTNFAPHSLVHKLHSMNPNSRLPERTRPNRVKPPPREPSPTPPSWSASSKPSTDHSDSDTDSDSSAPETFHDAHFPPDHEAALLTESHALKSTANAQFAAQDYSQAISTYDRALASCPNYLDFEIGVLQSNIAACHLKLEQWREAIQSADRALEALDREDPPPVKKEKGEKKTKKSSNGKESGKAKIARPNGTLSTASDPDSDADDDGVPHPNGPVVELPASDDDDGAAALHALTLSDERLASINRIRTKSLLRRARASSSLAASNPQSTIASTFSTNPSNPKSSSPGSAWTLLSAALADYTLLSKPPYASLLPASDARTVRQALLALPPQIEAAKQKETAEMMGKLKELGNGILKPFGLSTDMFKMVQDPKTGGYSMSFEQGEGKK
jgi:tetratricopeptide (TPR) repeat protein